MGGEIPNIVSRWANVESQELNTPIRYLFRRAVPDSGGPGKYRGGVCHEYAFTPNRTKGPMGLVLFGKGTRAPMSLGIFGGYPGCNVGYSTFRRRERGRAACGPRRRYAASSREDQFWGQLELDHEDVQYVRFMGGGGYGDPIDRDPVLVARGRRARPRHRGPRPRDLRRCRRGDGAVDEQATAARRREVRAERLGREPGGPDMRRAVEPTGMRISEYLQRTAGGGTQCTWCSAEVAAAGRDWKDDAALRRLPAERAGPLRTASGEFFLIEAYCPTCGTLLDTDLAAGDDPPLHDRIAHWPA